LDDDEHIVYQNKRFFGTSEARDSQGRLLRSINYHDGLDEGETRTYYYESQKPKERYQCKRGGRHGRFTSWHENGQVSGEALYQYNICVFRKAWNETGEVIEEFALPETEQDATRHTLRLLREVVEKGERQLLVAEVDELLNLLDRGMWTESMLTLSTEIGKDVVLRTSVRLTHFLHDQACFSSKRNSELDNETRQELLQQSQLAQHSERTLQLFPTIDRVVKIVDKHFHIDPNTYGNNTTSLLDYFQSKFKPIVDTARPPAK
jgi:hypothetical protein